jgi:RNA polymerase sigma-70 factor (ECF subfamily)
VNLRTEDTDLARLLQKGDKQAFKTLFDRYGARLYFFAFKYLKEKEDARDLLNEVFLKLWENRQNLKTDSSLQAYLFTIAYNNIRQRFLKKAREEKYIRVFAEEYLTETSKKEELLDYQLFAEKLTGIIDQLPPRRKEIFILSYKEGLKNYQIAEKLELSDHHVKKQLVIARKFITDKIKDDDGIAGLLFLYLFVGGSLN